MARAGLFPGPDVTSAFESLHGAAERGETVLPAHARNFKYLLVPGLIGDLIPKYMGANLKALTEQGLDAEIVDLRTQRSAKTNQELLRQAVLDATADGSQVILVGHSFGATLSHDLLINHPELTPKIGGLLALQPAIGGSPLASDLAHSPRARAAIERVFRSVDGEAAVFDDITLASRREFMSDPAHRFPLEKVPAVTVRSTSTDPRAANFIGNLYMRRDGAQTKENDGQVVKSEALIPGAPTVTLTGMDHLAGAAPDWASPSRYDGGSTTLAGVALLFRSVPPPVERIDW